MEEVAVRHASWRSAGPLHRRHHGREFVSGEFFGVRRLQDSLLGALAVDVQGVCDLLFERVDQFQAGAAQFDDMALLGD